MVTELTYPSLVHPIHFSPLPSHINVTIDSIMVGDTASVTPTIYAKALY